MHQVFLTLKSVEKDFYEDRVLPCVPIVGTILSFNDYDGHWIVTKLALEENAVGEFDVIAVCSHYHADRVR